MADQGLVLGKGFHTDIDGLHLHVEVRYEGWMYRIIQPKGNETLKDWTLPPHTSTGKYTDPEHTKFHAVSDALLKLNRPHDDPDEVFWKLEWRPYGPGH